MSGHPNEEETRAEIRRLLDEAMCIYGPSLQLKAIEASWGDTLSDAETLEAIRDFVKTGSIFDQMDIDADHEELDRLYREGLTRH